MKTTQNEGTNITKKSQCDTTFLACCPLCRIAGVYPNQHSSRSPAGLPPCCCPRFAPKPFYYQFAEAVHRRLRRAVLPLSPVATPQQVYSSVPRSFKHPRTPAQNLRTTRTGSCSAVRRPRVWPIDRSAIAPPANKKAGARASA